jgi:hypothetical protein
MRTTETAGRPGAWCTTAPVGSAGTWDAVPPVTVCRSRRRCSPARQSRKRGRSSANGIGLAVGSTARRARHRWRSSSRPRSRDRWSGYRSRRSARCGTSAGLRSPRSARVGGSRRAASPTGSADRSSGLCRSALRCLGGQHATGEHGAKVTRSCCRPTTPQARSSACGLGGSVRNGTARRGRSSRRPEAGKRSTREAPACCVARSTRTRSGARSSRAHRCRAGVERS